MIVKIIRKNAFIYFKEIFARFSNADNLGALGSGAGKGGGGGGKIREAGGSLGKHAAAKEEEWFHKKTKEQLEDLKEQVEQRAKEQQEEIDRLESEIEAQKKLLEDIQKCFKKKY